MLWTLFLVDKRMWNFDSVKDSKFKWKVTIIIGKSLESEWKIKCYHNHCKIIVKWKVTIIIGESLESEWKIKFYHNHCKIIVKWKVTIIIGGKVRAVSSKLKKETLVTKVSFLNYLFLIKMVCKECVKSV